MNFRCKSSMRQESSWPNTSSDYFLELIRFVKMTVSSFRRRLSFKTTLFALMAFQMGSDHFLLTGSLGKRRRTQDRMCRLSLQELEALERRYVERPLLQVFNLTIMASISFRLLCWTSRKSERSYSCETQAVFSFGMCLLGCQESRMSYRFRLQRQLWSLLPL